jgi:hypothetical protein
MGTSTIMADPVAGRVACEPRIAFVLAGGAALGAMAAGWSTPCTNAASRPTCSSAPRPAVGTVTAYAAAIVAFAYALLSLCWALAGMPWSAGSADTWSSSPAGAGRFPC